MFETIGGHFLSYTHVAGLRIRRFSYTPCGPRAKSLLFNPKSASKNRIVSIVEFYAEFKNARLTTE